MMDFTTPPPRSRYYDPRPVRPIQTKPVEEPSIAVEPQPVTPHRRRALASANRWKFLLIIIIIIVVAGLAYGYITTKNQLENKIKKNSASSVSSSRPSPPQSIVGQVGQLVDLPSNETPTIATVSDISKLKNQTFYADAMNGDKVLIYSKVGKAVLYRPSTNKVIEYSTINLAKGTGQ